VQCCVEVPGHIKDWRVTPYSELWIFRAPGARTLEIQLLRVWSCLKEKLHALSSFGTCREYMRRKGVSRLENVGSKNQFVLTMRVLHSAGVRLDCGLGCCLEGDCPRDVF
jgi:hypothetical protein